MLYRQILTGEKPHFGLQLVGMTRVLREQQQRPFLLSSELGDGQGQAGTEQAAPCGLVP